MGKVHEYIKKLRIQGGYSQDEMADLMGIERSTYSNFELGKTNLFSRNLAKFARVIGKDEEDILLGEPRLRGYLSENILQNVSTPFPRRWTFSPGKTKPSSKSLML
ncbi:MAG: helix-turn-helix transcriptional regulator [Bacteroidales bacterium]|nr:helix-turn-helix transcriptional regulator [Bacteroidales bacterium]